MRLLVLAVDKVKVDDRFLVLESFDRSFKHGITSARSLGRTTRCSSVMSRKKPRFFGILSNFETPSAIWPSTEYLAVFRSFPNPY
jgi:hypothetical protein